MQQPAGVRRELFFPTASAGACARFLRREVDRMANKPGRPKKFKPAEFREAVEAWFRSISVRMVNEAVRNLDDEPVERIVYATPPTISGLCLRLGIDRSTWQNYADPEKNPKHAKVCEDVRLRIEAYLEEQLLTREKSLQGIIFNLQNNYGWTEKHEHSQRVELGEETRKVVAQNLTLDEKFALIREAAAEITETEDHGDDEPDE